VLVAEQRIFDQFMQAVAAALDATGARPPAASASTTATAPAARVAAAPSA
jgi:hypothetical protein